MKKTTAPVTMPASSPAHRAALGSPLRMEILGLFTGGEPLSVSDMAELMGRSAVSLYHHVGVLEKAGLLLREGERRKGKRFEAMFRPAASRFDLEAEKGEEQAAFAVKAVGTAFRMAERDLEAALGRDDVVDEGPGRNLLAMRMHMLASPKLLAGINRHLEAIDALIVKEIERGRKPAPGAQHLSLTLALLPLKGRGGTPSDRGDRS